MGEKLLALDPKRRRFVEEYRVDWNATQAAIRAGYSAKTAKVQGCQLLTKLNVQEALAEVMAEATDRTQISADAIIAETAKIAFVNMMDYMRIGENGEPFVDLSALTRAQAAGLLAFKYKERVDGRGEDARDVCEVEIKINPQKLNALIKLGERLGVWKPQAGDGDAQATLEHYQALEKMRREWFADLDGRFALPAPEKAG